MKRYDVFMDFDDSVVFMSEKVAEDGEYVKYEDVEKLIDANNKMLEALKEAGMTLSGRIAIDTLSIVMDAIKKAEKLNELS